jgi:polyhydroxyalkanoate synthesis regulator phasin
MIDQAIKMANDMLTLSLNSMKKLGEELVKEGVMTQLELNEMDSDMNKLAKLRVENRHVEATSFQQKIIDKYTKMIQRGI